MATFFRALRTAAAKRAAYNRTAAERSRLDVHAAFDVNIYRGDIPEIARKAVYGR